MADNTELIQDAYDGFARGDLAPLLGILDDNVESVGAVIRRTSGA